MRSHFLVRFRSFSSTAIDRRIGIAGFGMEKITFDSFRKIYGAQAKNCSGPENRDASISSCKYIASAHIFSIVFDRFRAPRSIDASVSIDSTSKKWPSIPLGKCEARKQKIVRAPKTATHRFLYANVLQALTFFRPFSIVFEHRDRSTHRHRSIRRRKNDLRFL